MKKAEFSAKTFRRFLSKTKLFITCNRRQSFLRGEAAEPPKDIMWTTLAGLLRMHFILAHTTLQT